jgi:hypothetical protein
LNAFAISEALNVTVTGWSVGGAGAALGATGAPVAGSIVTICPNRG